MSCVNVGDALLKSEKVESHEEAIVRHLKGLRIQEIKVTYLIRFPAFLLNAPRL